AHLPHRAEGAAGGGALDRAASPELGAASRSPRCLSGGGRREGAREQVMIERSHHATFTIERDYGVAPARVFKAWADPAAKARWFVGPEGWTLIERSHDFRIGGRETVSG